MRFPTLPVDLLDDGLIECGDYPDWASACSEIKRYPEDRKVLDELLWSIPEEGVMEPLWIEIRGRNPQLVLADGHHRAVALMELGIREFPYLWRWRFPKGMPQPGVLEPLPEHLLDLLKERAGA